MLDKIESLYPKAYSALNKEYKQLTAIPSLKRFNIVNRFCRCNFGTIDNIRDIDGKGRFVFEYVPCPLRGECRLEGVVCAPEFNSKISDSEMRVLELLYRGFEKEEIAEKLHLSIHTINNHIRNAYTRLGFHEKAEFIDYAHRNKIFKNE
ncbi:MAG: helix-turn-helix transcriptional regulator [Holosporaceae bacterium]|nr:helix-turn-helix transcriptional regulator [Holosporaceae bacterium]